MLLRLWYFYSMRTTIDQAGRIVVPKALREALNLKPGQALDIRLGDGRLEVEVAATPMTLRKQRVRMSSLSLRSSCLH